LKSKPAPEVAAQRYEKDVLLNRPDDANVYSNIVSSVDDKATPIVKRPKSVEALYDTFVNIRADEAAHARAMRQLQQQVTLLQPGRKE